MITILKGAKVRVFIDGKEFKGLTIKDFTIAGPKEPKKKYGARRGKIKITIMQGPPAIKKEVKK
jgi:hypothetical protein